MKILIDINHPAHVHYFRNFIRIMSDSGHEFIITNRDNSLINQLLDYYQIPHLTRNKRPTKKSKLGSIHYLLNMIWRVFKVARREKPDLYLGFASVPCAFMSFYFKKPGIIIDDTEHNSTNHAIYSRFCSDILTPHYFEKEMGEKQIRFQAYVEQFYLHSDFFTPEIKNEDYYVLIRFISYDAGHDTSVRGIATLEDKFELVRELSKRAKVYISLENNLECHLEFQQFQLNISPEQMHSVIVNASLFISEGATMASEAGILGVQYYYINPLKVGNINLQVQEFEHAHQDNITNLLKKIKNISLQKSRSEIVNIIEADTINPTKFLVWFIQNYPESKEKCKYIVDKEFAIRVFNN